MPPQAHSASSHTCTHPTRHRPPLAPPVLARCPEPVRSYALRLPHAGVLQVEDGGNFSQPERERIQSAPRKHLFPEGLYSQQGKQQSVIDAIARDDYTFLRNFIMQGGGTREFRTLGGLACKLCPPDHEMGMIVIGGFGGLAGSVLSQVSREIALRDACGFAPRWMAAAWLMPRNVCLNHAGSGAPVGWRRYFRMYAVAPSPHTNTSTSPSQSLSGRMGVSLTSSAALCRWARQRPGVL